MNQTGDKHENKSSHVDGAQSRKEAWGRVFQIVVHICTHTHTHNDANTENWAKLTTTENKTIS